MVDILLMLIGYGGYGWHPPWHCIVLQVEASHSINWPTDWLTDQFDWPIVDTRLWWPVDTRLWLTLHSSASRSITFDQQVRPTDQMHSSASRSITFDQLTNRLTDRILIHGYGGYGWHPPWRWQWHCIVLQAEASHSINWPTDWLTKFWYTAVVAMVDILLDAA